MSFTLLRNLAVTVRGYEAAAFRVSGGSGTCRLTNTVHIRPDDAPAEERTRAIEAFQEMTGQAVAGGADAVFRVGEVPSGPADKLMFCIVMLLRQKSEVRSAIAIIIQSRGRGEALKQLSTLRTAAVTSGLDVGGDDLSPPAARGGQGECWN